MGMNDFLAEAMVEEYEEKGKKISFELARLVVQAETCDSIVKLMMHTREFSAEKIAALLGVSLRFVEISMARHGRVKKRKPESEVTVWEQIWEMRKRDDSASYGAKTARNVGRKNFLSEFRSR